MTVLQLLNPEKKPVIPNTRKISRLVEAVAIFKDRATTTLTTARNDDERMDSHGKKWIFERNQKAALLNLCAATFPSDEARSP